MNEAARKIAVAVLVSGSGSNLQALIDASLASDYPAEIALVISNRPNVKAIERAAKASIPHLVIDHKAFASREAFEAILQESLRAHEIELICLAGFMRVLTEGFVTRWPQRILNIHPSLLPAFKGLHVHKQALEAGVSQSGCSVHYVTAGLDDGPVLGQRTVPVLAGDTEDSLAARILHEEHILYPEILAEVAADLRRPQK